MMKTLTPEQRRQWTVNGHLTLEQVLGTEEVEFFSRKLDEIRAQPGYEPMHRPMGHYEWVDQCEDLQTDGFMDRRDLLPYDQAFVDLIDRPGVFDLLSTSWVRTSPSACRRPSCGRRTTFRVIPTRMAARVWRKFE